MSKISTILPQDPDSALIQALERLSARHVKTDSRNGPVLRFPGLTVTEWVNPTHRISWSPIRDANPFLHYIEAFWMLAGRNDVALVSKLAANMANYSDDGVTLFGAYGWRWRNHFGQDQITKIIDVLKKDPTSRRCVLQMWDGAKELDTGAAGGRDLCCNHAISFDPCNGVLNMTVSNRSNDLVWGADGANVVHMSILHEYVAHQTGLKLGTYFQASSNLHLYLENPVTQRLCSYEDGTLVVKPEVYETDDSGPQTSLFDDLSATDSDFTAAINVVLNNFMGGSKDVDIGSPSSLNLLSTLCAAFNIYKASGANAAHDFLSHSQNPWAISASKWLTRRPSYVS